jgi:MFS superfamily sulfate permease-like transporter
MGFVSHGIVIGFLHSNGMIIVANGIVGYTMENRDKNHLVASSHSNLIAMSKEKVII